jgi:riboflavin-specific deaminase-like protein
VERLLPDPGPTTPAEQYSGLGLVELAHPDRPYVVTNFALTLDGRATISGRSGPIGDRTDSEVLHRLRTQVDAVMIGAGTLRVERYGRIVPDPALRGHRERAAGVAHDPLAVIVTDSLDLPWDAGLFTAGFGRVLIFTSSDAEIPDTATEVRVERHEGRVDLRRAMSRLHDERGVRAVLCEGGPHLHANLVSAGLVDEMFITLAPKLGLNEGPGLLEDGFGDLGPTVLELVWLLAEDGELFTRYRLRR